MEVYKGWLYSSIKYEEYVSDTSVQTVYLSNLKKPKKNTYHIYLEENFKVKKLWGWVPCTGVSHPEWSIIGWDRVDMIRSVPGKTVLIHGDRTKFKGYTFEMLTK